MLTAYLSRIVSRHLGLLRAVGYAVLIVAASPCPSAAADDEASDPHEHGHPASTPAPTTGDHLTELDHPLWRGRLEKGDREQRVREFDQDWNRIDFRRGEGGPVFRRYLDDLGVKEIVRYFEDKNAFCHGELHDLGSLLLERTGNLAVSLAFCGDACTYSCTHGVLREYFAGHKAAQHGSHAHTQGAGTEYEGVDVNRLRDEIIDLCRQDSTIIKGFLRGNCGHAIGHAFGVISGGSMRKAQEHSSVTYVASKPSEVNRVCAFGDEVDKEMCVSGLGLLKDKHDRKEAIVSACERLVSDRLKVACLEQTQRSYYQADNPLFEKMLVGQVQPQ